MYTTHTTAAPHSPAPPAAVGPANTGKENRRK